jgi:DNA-binding transcriptional LysR family regulator
MAQRRPPATTELDLNLLVLLDALLHERNVTRAAERVGLSQSAASHALKRLRDHFDDPLLVRGRDGMALAARAKALAAPIDHALRTLEATLRDSGTFDPRRSRHTFTIAMTDYLAVLLLPALHARVAREAHGIDLRVTAIVADVEATLSSEETDLVITMAAQPEEPGLYQQRLFEERYVCVMRRGHLAARRQLTLDAFCALDHALISPRNGRGVVDRALAVVGRERRVAAQLPHWLVAPHLVAERPRAHRCRAARPHLCGTAAARRRCGAARSADDCMLPALARAQSWRCGSSMAARAGGRDQRCAGGLTSNPFGIYTNTRHSAPGSQ